MSGDRARWVALALLALVAAGAVALLVRDHVRVRSEPSSAPPAEPSQSPALFGPPVFVGDLASVALDEVSGLAASRRRSDLLWVHNDSGSPPRLYAVGPDGSHRGVARVRGATDRDWEDLASFELDGVPYLLIGDVGDNTARRRRVELHVVEEPAIEPEGVDDRMTVDVAWSIEVRFEDGALDCEGVAVDVARQRVLLISKRTVPLRLYEVPLRPGGRDTVVATRVADIALPQPVSEDFADDPQFGPFRSQATALDVSPDGRELLVLTYKDAYLFTRAEGEGWAEAVTRPFERVALPRMRQTEAGGYGADGRSVWVTTEQRPTPLFRLDRLPGGAPDL